MATEIRQYTLAIPAGTLATAPATLDTSFPARVVDRIEIVVPAGPNGTVGFKILNSDVQIIPYGSDEWVVTSNESISWDLDGYIDSGSWQLAAYNGGINQHSIYIRYLLSLPGTTSSGTAPTTPIDPALLGSGNGDLNNIDLNNFGPGLIGQV